MGDLMGDTTILGAPASSVQYQATTLAGNRLSEMILTGDSTDVDIQTGKDGFITTYSRGITLFTLDDGQEVIIGPASEVEADHIMVDYDMSSFEALNDDEMIVNQVNLAASGGTEITAEDGPSISKYQVRSYSRSDMIYEVADEVIAADHIADRMLARGTATYRPGSCTIDSLHSLWHLYVLAVLDSNRTLTVKSPDGATFNNATIAGYTLYIKNLPDGIHITGDIEFGVSHNFSWEAE
jgi:hypothetical protein